LEDRILVERLLRKDEEAERYFFEAYRDRLYKVSVSFLGYQDPEAEDVTQEVFLVALRKLSGFEFRFSLFTWLYCICVNLCYARMESRRKLVSHLDEELETLAGPRSLALQHEREDEAERGRKLELMRSQKERLGSFCRDLLEMRDGKGGSYAQMAKELKVPIGTVMSRLARCKEALKRLVLGSMEGGADV
jgi:RNA polymerase sigma-70 factor (ECF subfamily)